MAIKSNNSQGNPYHDESSGEFTSPNSSGNEQQKISSSTPTLKIKVKGEGLTGLANKLNDLNQCANVPKLSSGRDIESHIEEYFSKQVCDKINELYGNSANCASYQYRPKSNPRKVLEIFPNVLAKYRYKDNHAHYISNEEYSSMVYQQRLTRIYRGFSSTGQKAMSIKDSYVNPDLNSFDLLCPAGNNCFGSNVYTSTSRSVAIGYAGGYDGTIIDGVLDERGAYHMNSKILERIRDSIDYNSIKPKIEQKFISNGIEADKSARIAKSFVNAMSNDIGICGILLGLDYFEANDSQAQKNLLNVSRWYIKQ